VSETCLLTGCAGFLGSHLAERLLDEGHTVIGVDCFTEQYSRVQKQANLASLRGRSGFEFVEGDLTRLELQSLMEGVTVVYHLAAQSALRFSWGRDFAAHDRNNVLATQLLLEASLQINRFVFASSASVYGDCGDAVATEQTLVKPMSPYAVTKLAAENLCHAVAAASHLPVVSLRLSTIYGPRQRPDMAFYKFLRTALEGRAIDVYGNGAQTRDYLYVSDAVGALVAAMTCGTSGSVFNVGSGSSVSTHEVVEVLRELLPDVFQVRHSEAQRGDSPRVQLDTSLARSVLGFEPKVSLPDGLRHQLAWVQELLASS
jgi:nucleoside-diphosphate-sugar epimerase